MVFSSLTFLCVFLPVVFILYNILPGIKTKNALLIAASLLFYAYGEPIYVLLMLASTVMNWIFGLGCCSPKKNIKICYLLIAIISNLAFLGLFKYADMFVDSINNFSFFDIKLPGISLPLGISFYTFQALSYVIDVYRGEVKPQKNYFNVLLYISFFPQLIAGPIVKYHDIEQQITNRKANIEDISSGIVRFCVGLGKKVLIANTMGNIVDVIYSTNNNEINFVVAWIAALCYIMQIYFDFSGYSDMAIGMASMFGFHYKENFNYPYTAKTVKEFWRMWHISLSTWFKDYLYIPLGGNRKGAIRASINKIIVFFTCGLWHGANWTFVIWGLGHGLFLLMEDFVPIKKLPKPITWIYTVLIVTVLFVIFRAETVDQGLFMISQMFSGFHFEEQCMQLSMQMLSPINVTTFIFACFASLKFGKIIYSWAQTSINTNVLTAIKYTLAAILLVMCILTLSGGGYNPFIYFRF